MLYLCNDGLYCGACGAHYRVTDHYLDMMPQGVAFDYVSKYVAEEEQLAAELDYRALAPPLLAAGVRNRALVRLLDLRPHDIALDSGCGTAKFAAWNATRVDLMVGSDPVTLFADAAVAHVALLRADSRRLPFATNSFDKAFSIDVLEHFPLDVIDDYLAETARVLRPGGRFLAFSNTREPSPIQPIIDVSRRIGRGFVQMGVYDFEREALRKSDHLKALATWEDVQAAFARAGLRPVKVVFWNSLFTTFVEHVLMKLGEAVVGRGSSDQPGDPAAASSPTDAPPATGRSNGTAPPTTVSTGTAREIRARQRLRGSLRPGNPVYHGLQAVTLVMELDLWLFGWMRSGSYFIVVEKPAQGGH